MNRVLRAKSILLRNLWMLVAAGVTAGLAPLPTASAAHGFFYKGRDKAVAHGFRSSPFSHHRSAYAVRSPWFGSGYVVNRRSGFYWPRQNMFPAAPSHTPRIYVVPQQNRTVSSSGHPVRRTITIHPSPFQEAGSAILTQASDTRAEEETEMVSLQAILAENRASSVPVDAANSWQLLEEGKSKSALAAFSHLAMEEPDVWEHKIGYGLAAALQNDTITACYAFRLVYRSVSAGHRFVLSDELDGQLRAHQNAWENRLRQSGTSAAPDEVFLAAVFCDLLGQGSEGLEWLGGAETHASNARNSDMRRSSFDSAWESLANSLRGLTEPEKSQVAQSEASHSH